MLFCESEAEPLPGRERCDFNRSTMRAAKMSDDPHSFAQPAEAMIRRCG